METGNQAAVDSLRPTFKRGFTSFFKKKVWSLTRDSGAVAVDVLSAKIADSASMLLSFSFASAVQIAGLSLQIQSKLPPSFHLLSLSILLGFASLLVAKLVEFKIPKPAKFLNCLGFLSLVIAFFIAISIPYPLYFTIISFTVFFATLAFMIYFTIISETDSLSLSISNETE